MKTFFICLGLLVAGYFIYGYIVARIFGADDRETPAVTMNDGVDYVVMPQWRLFLIQLLNIAGLGPIFGAVAGALWGPVVFLWITFGTIFAGAVHDYFSGMLSVRNKGVTLSEIVGIYLGGGMKCVARLIVPILLVLVGSVFAYGPAALIVMLFQNAGIASGPLISAAFWLVIILTYYFIATFIPIDKIIGKIYPVFGICLIVMAVGVAAGMILGCPERMPELWDHFSNMHPKGTPIWAFMFITVACGAISGFHATQSPLMARCMRSERQGRFVFYGAMVCEGIIALIWAAAGCTLFEVTDGQMTGLAARLAAVNPAGVVYDVCSSTMGSVGVFLAMLGVIACPITSGDTAFRSARLGLADWFGLRQERYFPRLVLTVPLLAAGAWLSQHDFAIIWRYFSWTNQTMAVFVLWAASMHLLNEKKNYWITAVPGTFMSAVSATYFFMAPECLGLLVKLPAWLAYVLGVIVAVLCLKIFLRAVKRRQTLAAEGVAE